MAGMNFDFNDKRLSYIYNELVKRYQFKPDTWMNMIQTPVFNVNIYNIHNYILFSTFNFYVTY